MTALPGWIAGVLEAKLENVSRTELRTRAQRISERYRSGGTSDVIRSDLDALAYAIVRMPATYAAVRAALAQIVDVIPDFRPGSMLDVGAGPGTASWAAFDAWPSLQDVTLIDANPHLLALATAFRETPAAPDMTLTVRRDTAAALGQANAADVVMGSYVFAEIGGAAMIATLEKLWGLSGRVLIIVEPGTPDGFRRILACRETLLARGAQIVAPCSHEGRCPLAASERWCHFNVRLPRSRDHLAAKDVSVPFEDEKFAYLVAGKGFGALTRGKRVLAMPKVDKIAVTLTLCTPDVPEQYRIARGDKDAYRAAKRLDWGDAIMENGSRIG
jgi:ribosomal protein RSM22 (predicted rRNA methylase)